MFPIVLREISVLTVWLDLLSHLLAGIFHSSNSFFPYKPSQTQA